MTKRSETLTRTAMILILCVGAAGSAMADRLTATPVEAGFAPDLDLVMVVNAVLYCDPDG